MRLKDIMEVAVRRDDPEMMDYGVERNEKEQDSKDAPYYVSWTAQSWEWYGDGGPDDGNGRYKAKGDGGRVVAINIASHAQAMQIAQKLDDDYKSGDFPDKNVYGHRDSDGYYLEYHGSDVSSMSKMDSYDKEMIKTIVLVVLVPLIS